MSLALAAVTGILFAAGTWLLLQRRLTRIIIGIGLLGHGANLLLVTSGGRAGNPGHRRISWEPRRIFRPLPQALALTAIVITFGVTAFLLALGYRSWQISRDDKVEDDLEDRMVARRNELDGPEGPVDDGDPDTNEFEAEGTRNDEYSASRHSGCCPDFRGRPVDTRWYPARTATPRHHRCFVSHGGRLHHRAHSR